VGRSPGVARNRCLEPASVKYLSFVEADGLVLPQALETMTGVARRTKSEIVKGSYRRHSAMGSHRPEDTARIHARQKLDVNVETFPDLLDEPVLWNGLYRASFWRTEVHPLPEAEGADVQELSLGSMLRARSIDVIDTDVYSWRLHERLVAGSRSPSRLEELARRRAAIQRLRSLLND